ncbi:lysozyme inhibitor LprI family protein [Shewanella sp. Arc9-LZ]|uniref:lysozyme inhibitor LprI family protein n=1 Tax=Shewanella sp. Arc9-LZ TaxID=2698686 RepID=UPI00137B9AE1|nr:lysozyme inhibitor LprI family protein [Shewanella sp. Arc9-LZ]QHS12385.1 DUF1311 domain-containing protein [Shewanella sp. Arc9-LZ]
MFNAIEIVLILIMSPVLCSATEHLGDSTTQSERLDKAYDDVINLLANTQKKTLKKAQLNWLAYRDMTCAFEGGFLSHNHWFEDDPAQTSLQQCLSRLIDARIIELTQYTTLIKRSNAQQTIEYTNAIQLIDQIELEVKKAAYGQAGFKGSFTFLINKSERRSDGSVTFHTQANPNDERNIQIDLLTKAASDFKATYGTSAEYYLLGKTVVLKATASRVESIKRDQIGRQSSKTITRVPIGSLSELTIHD